MVVLCVSNYTDDGITVESLAVAKRLPVQLLRDCGFRDLPNGAGIFIDYGRHKRGRVRTDLVAKEGSYFARRTTRRVMGRDEAGKLINNGTGKPVWLEIPIEIGAFCPATPEDCDTFALIVEGETDTLAAIHHGYFAVGIPGSRMGCCLELSDLHGRQTVYIHQEPDSGGAAFVDGIARRLRAVGYTGRILVFSVPVFKDLCDLHSGTIDDPDTFDAWLRPALAQARPAKEPEPSRPRTPRPADSDPLSLDLSGIDLAAIITEDLGPPTARSGRWSTSPPKWFCPFHADQKTPNLATWTGDDGKNRFTCYACGETGDAIDFISLRKKISFAESCRFLGLDWKKLPSRANSCRELSVGISSLSDSSRQVFENYSEYFPILPYCPNEKSVVMRHNDYGTTIIVDFPCHRLACVYCRPRWDHERATYYRGKIEANSELYWSRTKTADKKTWNTVRQAMRRCGADYVAIKEDGGTTLLVSTQRVPGTAPATTGKAVAMVDSAIRLVVPGTNRPITHSAGWTMPKDEPDNSTATQSGSKYRRLCQTTAKTEKIMKTLAGKGIKYSSSSWEHLEASVLRIDVDSWSDDDVVGLIQECEAFVVRLKRSA